MASLSEIRAQYPQYNDMSDMQLATSFHKKFYSDMPFEAFTQKIGFAPQQQGPQQPPQEQPAPWYTPITAAPGNAWDMAKGLGEGVAGQVTKLAHDPRRLNPLVAAYQDVRDIAAPIAADPQGAYDAAKQGLDQGFGTPTRAWNTVANHPIDTLMMAAPGVGMLGKGAQMGGMTRTARVLGKASSIMDPVNLVTKPIEVAYNAMQPSPMRAAAKSLNVPKGALSDVSNSIGDIGAAQAQAGLLGPDAMAAHLSPQATQDARALAAMSLKDGSSAELAKRAQGVVDRSGDRARADWERAVGPAKSRYDKILEVGKQKAGTSDLYTVAKGRIVDPSPIVDEIPNLVDAIKNNPKSREFVSELNSMLIDPRSGGLVTDAGELLNVRQRIDEMIKSVGAGQTVTPGVDIYSLGEKTITGGHLKRLRRVINDTLHQDPMLAQADATFAGAERTRSAFELGNKGVIGRGDSVMEPQAIQQRLLKMKPEERSSYLEGIARKGQNAIGDIGHNRNDGKAMADAFATKNNLDRLSASGVNSNIVKRMAEREDALAAGSNRILGGSDTARTDLAKSKYQPIGSLRDYASSGPVGAGLLAGAYALGTANPLLGVGLAGAGVGIKGLMNMSRSKKASGAAKLLSRQGPELQSLLSTLDKAGKTKSKTLQITGKNRLLIRGLLGSHMAPHEIPTR